MKYFAHSQKEFVYKYVVMLSDIDQFKHMSFANYLKLMFLATDALMLGVPNYTEMIEKYRFKVFDTRMQFKNQTIFGDNILIKVNTSNVTNTTFTLLYTYVIEETAKLVALAKLRASFYKKDQSISTIPKEIVSILESISVNEDNLLFKY